MTRRPNRYLTFAYAWVDSVVDPFRLFPLPHFLGYARDCFKYRRMEGAEKISLFDTYPCLRDKTARTRIDRHYFYQDIWAFRRIYESKVERHVDVGSRVDFVGMLTAVINVEFIDIRPLEVSLDRFLSWSGSVLDMPFADNSVASLSSLHVLEHIGLGRYGDSLNPHGTQQAARELSRVLAPGGNLFVSMPVGKPRLCFNAHRIHSPEQILRYFAGLRLVEFCGIDDAGNFIRNPDVTALGNCEYGCGLFWFTKE